MSFGAAHESRIAIETCKSCRERNVRIGSPGAVRGDQHHHGSLCGPRRASTLCFECWRSERDRRGPPLSAGVRFYQPTRSPLLPLRSLGPSDIAHRRLMLAAMLAQQEGA